MRLRVRTKSSKRRNSNRIAGGKSVQSENTAMEEIREKGKPIGKEKCVMKKGDAWDSQ